jgi:hypothetical protein
VLRFFLAGMLTVGALVLLFIGSFGDPMGTLQDLGATLSITGPSTQAPALRQADQPVPVTQPPATPAPQSQTNQPAQAAAAAPSAQPAQPPAVDPEREALAQQLNQMRAQLSAETQQVSTLRTQADQERQDLQKLQQQRASEQQNFDQAKQGSVDEASARAKRADDLAKQIADQQAMLQHLQAESQQATTTGKQQQVALQQQVAAQQAQLDRLKADTAQAEAQHQRQMTEASRPTQPKSDAVAPAPSSEQGSLAAQPAPPQRLALASPPKQAAATKPDDREQVLQRLRHETAKSKSAAPAPDALVPNETTAQPAPLSQEPGGPPAQERLLEARNAAAAGRIDEARHLLQQAQVQLVLRPVSPWQSAPAGGSVAAGQIAEALSMLDAGDLPHAIQYINLAVAQASWTREITASSASAAGQGTYYPR